MPTAKELFEANKQETARRRALWERIQTIAQEALPEMEKELHLNNVTDLTEFEVFHVYVSCSRTLTKKSFTVLFDVEYPSGKVTTSRDAEDEEYDCLPNLQEWDTERFGEALVAAFMADLHNYLRKQRGQSG